jgi:phosphoglycerate kinase
MAATSNRQDNLNGKTVLVRASFEAGVTAGLGELAGKLADAGARVAVIAGYGDPLNDINPALSLSQFVEPLARQAGRPVTFIGECVGIGAEAGLDRVDFGEIALLENLRFHSARRQNARTFALKLSVLGDYFLDAGAPPASIDGWQAHLSALLPGPLPPQTANEIKEEV